MKICFLLNNLELGGAERVVAILSDYFVNEFCDVTIIVLNKLNNKQELNSKIRIVQLNQKRVFKSFFSLRNFFRTNSFDFIVGNMWPITIIGLLSSFFSFKKTKVLFIEHSIISNEYNHQNPIFQKIVRLSIRIFYNFSHRIICVSNGVANDLLKLGVKASKTKVIFNPVEIQKESYLSNESDNALLNWKGFDGIKILSVGNLRKNKNYPNLIRALKILREKYNQKFISLIVGEGPENRNLATLIRELDLENEVILVGGIRQTKELYENSDLFVLSSNYEGFGMVIVEALGYGKTIVATDCESGPREILDDSKYGYLCKVDCPESLADSIYKANLKNFNQDILFRRYKDFDIANIGKEYLTLLQRIQKS